MTTTTSTTSSTDVSALLAQAAQSVISGATKSTLDVNSLVSALVTAKTAGQAATLTSAQTSDNTELSAIGQIQSSLAALQTKLSGLSDGTSLTQLTATLSGTGITATPKNGVAVPGSYSINVQQIATANKISSGAYASSATLGTGTVTIGVGSSSMTVNLTSANNTLSGLASTINNASNNPGVTATVITAADGQHLVLTSNATGAANTVSRHQRTESRRDEREQRHFDGADRFGRDLVDRGQPAAYPPTGRGIGRRLARLGSTSEPAD